MHRTNKAAAHAPTGPSEGEQALDPLHFELLAEGRVVMGSALRSEAQIRSLPSDKLALKRSRARVAAAEHHREPSLVPGHRYHYFHIPGAASEASAA